jgi:hypothetical protein
MAKTTADVTLVKGAAAMGAAQMPADLSGLDKIIDKGNEMQGEVSAKIEAEKTRRKELTDKLKKDAEEVILNSGSLGKGIYDSTFSKMEGLQTKYNEAVQNGNEQERLDILRQVQAHSVFIQDHKETRLDYATKIDNNEQSKGIGKENLHAINKIQAQEYEYGENEKGEPVFKFQNTKGEDVEMTQAEYRKLYEPRHYETTNVIAKLLGKVEKGQHSALAAENEIAQTVDKMDERTYAAAMADDIMGQNFGQLLANDRTISKEIAMALGDDDGVIDDDELKGFIDAVTNPDNENYNFETSKKIFKQKLYNAVENKNSERLQAIEQQKLEKQAEKDKDEYTSVTTRKTVGGKVQLQVPGGEQGELLEASSAKVREIEDAVNKAEPNVGITGHFGFYYPRPKGGFVRYDNMEQFIELNGGGATTLADTQSRLGVDPDLYIGAKGGKIVSKNDILTTYEQTDAAKDEVTTKTTRKFKK